MRERQIPPLEIFPAEPWAVAAVRLDPRLVKEFAGQAETMFALANGYLGIRRMPEEGRPVRELGVFSMVSTSSGPLTTVSAHTASRMSNPAALRQNETVRRMPSAR